MYPLLETIAVSDFNAPYVAFHQQRMDDSFLQLFRQPNPFRLEVMLKQTIVPTSALYKWRILYGKDGVESSMEPYQPRVIKKIAFHEIPVDFDYSLKYANRSLFEEVKSVHVDCDEVILLKNGLLTDSLYANVVMELENDPRLFTPSTPLLAGTHRKRLLDKGIVVEKTIHVDEMSMMKKIYFINAMVEFENSPFFDVGF